MRCRTIEIRYSFAAAIVVALCAGRASAQAAEDAPIPSAPAEVVAALHAGIVAAAHDPARGIEARFTELKPLVERTHDLPYIAELSIRRYWAALTDDERDRFVAAFSRLSVMTYAARFGNATAAMFEILGSEHAGGDRMQVHAAINRATDSDVSLDYLLEEKDGGWKIINILADQVSDLALKRAEYYRVLGAGSIDDLIAELEKQADEMQ